MARTLALTRRQRNPKRRARHAGHDEEGVSYYDQVFTQKLNLSIISHVIRRIMPDRLFKAMKVGDVLANGLENPRVWPV